MPEDKAKVVVKAMKPEDFVKMLTNKPHEHNDEGVTVKAEEAIKAITEHNYVNLGVNIHGEMILNIQFPVAELARVLYSIEKLMETMTGSGEDYEPEQISSKTQDRMFG